MSTTITKLLGGRPVAAAEVVETKALAAAAGYTANDVLSESASAGTDWDFTDVARSGSYGVIVGAKVQSESESVTPRLRLFLFNAAPANCNLNDNAANTAPDASDTAGACLGFIDFPAMSSLGTTDSIAVATPNTPASNIPLPFKCAASSNTIYGVLVTRDDFTQTATEDMTITLLIEQY